MRKHVKRCFVDWLEQNVGERKRRFIEQHLQSCDECRSYYDRMSVMMERATFSAPHGPEPDPFLLTRIKELVAEGRQPVVAKKQPHLIRWSLATFGFTVATGIGVFLGRGLSEMPRQTENIDMTSSYYEAFSQRSFADHWEAVFDPNQKENK